MDPEPPRLFNCFRAFRPPQHAAQHEPSWMINAIKLNADASHIKAIMRVPSSARMFRFWSALVKTLVKMVNMTVATTEATMVKSAVMKVSTVKGRARRRTKVRRRWGGWD